jgi:alpha-ribazole phosphatase
VLLYLIRHPRPCDAAGLCYGRRDLGVAAGSVAEAAQAVRGRIPQAALRTAAVFSSPSTRCMLLARELAAPREPAMAEDLMEMSFGAWEGRLWDDLPREEVDAWADDVWNYRPGGAESAAMVAQRWARWSSSLRESADGMAVAVTHAGFIRVALTCAGLLPDATFSQERIEFGSVHRIELAQGGA